jgi:hypothetical protein
MGLILYCFYLDDYHAGVIAGIWQSQGLVIKVMIWPTTFLVEVDQLIVAVISHVSWHHLNSSEVMVCASSKFNDLMIGILSMERIDRRDSLRYNTNSLIDLESP